MPQQSRGHIWRQEPGQDGVPLRERWWSQVQPSSYASVGGESFADDPPVTKQGSNTEELLERCEREGLPDKQLLSWYAHGFPGVASLPSEVHLGIPHNGMLKHAKAAEEKNRADEEAGFITEGLDFPEFWPCRVDCCNIAERDDALRLCIDKTIQLFEEAVSFNDAIDLDEEERVY